jgi:LacI family transcriptional regulator
MVTAKKIAEAAKVSRSTVQRALSGDPRVAERTKARVLKIAVSLGYRPNRQARALVMRQQRLEYAVIIGIPENIFYREVLKGIDRAQEELRDFGVEVTIRYLHASDGREQAELIRSLCSQGKRGIVLVAYDCAEVREAIGAGAERGVAFVSMVSDVPRSRRLCFVGQDHHRSGRVAGGLMSMLIARGEKIACFIGSRQFLAHTERLKGFQERYLESHDAGDIVEVVEDFDSSKLAAELTRGLAARHPELRGIFVATAGVQGVCRGISDLGLKGKVRLVTYDLVQSRKACREGIIDFVIDQDPVQEGYQALILLNRHVMYREIPPEKQLTKIDIRTRDTVDL